ncbi:MAG: hypothetical protein HY342_09455 [Candidatus Lambdaproteobacteria bacterium]|nr:hypothetical protein [Candidatus Lambdaproteobacteria bacterium]
MARLLGFGKRQPKSVLRALEALEHGRTPVKLEIEGTDYRYTTTLAVKRDLLVFAKPLGLGKVIQKGGYIRFRLPDSDNLEVRAQVSTPEFSTPNGISVFLCPVPKEFVRGAHRGAERFNTARYNNLYVSTWDGNNQETAVHRHRIIDLSVSGCKLVHRKGSAKVNFPIGEPIAPAVMHLGNRLKIELASLTPRVHQPSAIGCEFVVEPEGLNLKYFRHLIVSLERSEATRLKVVTV